MKLSSKEHRVFMCRFLVTVLLVDLAVAQHVGEELNLVRCPGEDRSEDGTCHVDGGFVCLQVLGSTGQPLKLGSTNKDWWEITGQAADRWDQKIRDNHGDSWCTCAMCTSEVVDWVGCDALHIRCNATNIRDVFGISLPGYRSLEKCLLQQCPEEVPPKYKDGSMPLAAKYAEIDTSMRNPVAMHRGLVAGIGVCISIALFFLVEIRRFTVARHVPLLSVDEEEPSDHYVAAVRHITLHSVDEETPSERRVTAVNHVPPFNVGTKAPSK